jgi:hypothetical protein
MISFFTVSALSPVIACAAINPGNEAANNNARRIFRIAIPLRFQIHKKIEILPTRIRPTPAA